MRRFFDWLEEKLDAGGVWSIIIHVVGFATISLSTALWTALLVKLVRTIL